MFPLWLGKVFPCSGWKRARRTKFLSYHSQLLSLCSSVFPLKCQLVICNIWYLSYLSWTAKLAQVFKSLASIKNLVTVRWNLSNQWDWLWNKCYDIEWLWIILKTVVRNLFLLTPEEEVNDEWVCISVYSVCVYICRIVWFVCYNWFQTWIHYFIPSLVNLETKFLTLVSQSVLSRCFVLICWVKGFFLNMFLIFPPVE